MKIIRILFKAVSVVTIVTIGLLVVAGCLNMTKEVLDWMADYHTSSSASASWNADIEGHR